MVRPRTAHYISNKNCAKSDDRALVAWGNQGGDADKGNGRFDTVGQRGQAEHLADVSRLRTRNAP